MSIIAMSNFRALQPAPMDQEPQPQPQTRPILTSKPKRTVTLGACVACRKRKSKCDGNRPVCTCCSQKDTECIYELGPNEKPSQAMKRKNEEMQGELSNLRQLYDFLRLRPEHEAIEILRRIRSNSPDVPPSQRIQELADFVRHGDPPMTQQPLHKPSLNSLNNLERDPQHHVTLPSLRQALDAPSTLQSYSLPFPGLSPMGFDGPATQRRRHTHDLSARTESQSSLPRPTSIEAILHTPSNAAVDFLAADPRLGYISNWTRVTDDTGFLAHLFTIWTEREHVYYHFLDRDAFLADLSCSRGDFCSELLVNVVLASACFHSSAVKDRNKPFSEASIQTSFYHEAMRLWDLEKYQTSLTKVQAGMILYLVLGKYGRDRDGHRFLLGACAAAQSLGLFDHESPQQNTTPSHISVDRWKRARAATAWAVNNFQLSMAITYSFPVIISRAPSMPVPDETAAPLFRSECALHIILHDCVSIMQESEYINPHDAESVERIEACFSRLRSWWHTRPDSLDPDTHPSQVNLLCAMQYHVNIVKLFRPVLDRETTSGSPASYIDRAQSVISKSLKEIRRIVHLHDTHHGWSNAITFVMHGITIASFGTLDEISQNDLALPQSEIDDRYQGLVTCLRALAVLLSYSYYAQPLFRLLTQKCTALGVRLPAEVQGALDYCTSEEWTRKAAELVSSQFIADTRSVQQDTETMRMDAIISRWEGLTLEEKEACTTNKGKERGAA